MNKYAISGEKGKAKKIISDHSGRAGNRQTQIVLALTRCHKNTADAQYEKETGFSHCLAVLFDASFYQRFRVQ